MNMMYRNNQILMVPVSLKRDKMCTFLTDSRAASRASSSHFSDQLIGLPHLKDGWYNLA